MSLQIIVQVGPDVYNFVQNFSAEHLCLVETLQNMCYFSVDLSEAYASQVTIPTTVCIIARTIEFELNLKMRKFLVRLGYPENHFGIGIIVTFTQDINVYCYMRTSVDSYTSKTFNVVDQFTLLH